MSYGYKSEILVFFWWSFWRDLFAATTNRSSGSCHGHKSKFSIALSSKQIKSFTKYSLNISEGDKLREVSLKHDNYFLVSLRTMSFPQWKKIDRIREELRNLLNSFQELKKIKTCLTLSRLFLVLLCFYINREQAQCNKQKAYNNFGNT